MNQLLLRGFFALLYVPCNCESPRLRSMKCVNDPMDNFGAHVWVCGAWIFVASTKLCDVFVSRVACVCFRRAQNRTRSLFPTSAQR